MINKSKRKKVFMKYGGRCAYCGKLISFKHFTIDHFIPVSRFEEFIQKRNIKHLKTPNQYSNLKPAHKTCNQNKGNLLANEYRIKFNIKEQFYYEQYEKAYSKSN